MEHGRTGSPARPDPAHLEPGLRFDGFRLLRPLGDGGMGVIWLAEEVALDRIVVLKFLRQDRLASPDALARFRREALAEARVRHPGIVTVFAVGHAQGQPYIAQEYVEGGRTIASWIDEARQRDDRSRVYFRRVAELVAEACDAMHAAHEAGIVHRDVKPHNLLLTPEGKLKVADFGLARVTGAETVTDDGVALGTLPYCSPEQVSAHRELDRRTDLFGLGATLYEMLTFRRAFDGDSADAILQKVLHQDPPDPQRVSRHVPRDLAILCNKALEKRPEDRFTSMQDLADELRRFLYDEPLLTHSPSSIHRARKWMRRHPAAATTAGALVLAAGAVAWMWTKSTDRVADSQRELRETRESMDDALNSTKREMLLAKACLALEMEDLERAASFVAKAGVLDPSDYTGHLLLAAGYAKYARTPEARRQIELARERGFSGDPARLRTPLEHGAYGLYLLAQGDLARYAEAEEHVLRAIELDPSLTSLRFALYQLRRGRGDVAGARAALDELRGRLRSSEPFAAIVDAIARELAGDVAGAIAAMEELAGRSDIDAERLAELRWHRNMGRLCVAAGDLERAEEFLREALRETPDDGSSHAALAALFMRRYQAGERTAAVLAEIETAATEALRLIPGMREAAVTLAFARVERFALEPEGTDPASSAAHGAARAALDALPAGAATERRKLDARLLLLEARHPLTRRDYGTAADVLRAALEEDDTSLQAAALLGQCCWRLDEHADGLAVLQHALERVDGPKATRGPDEAHWVGVALTWALGNAVALGDADAVDAARTMLVSELDAGTRFEPEELLSAAEFLSAEAPDELRDCALARSLVEDHGLEAAFAGRPTAAQAAPILARIARACP